MAEKEFWKELSPEERNQPFRLKESKVNPKALAFLDRLWRRFQRQKRQEKEE